MRWTLLPALIAVALAACGGGTTAGTAPPGEQPVTTVQQSTAPQPTAPETTVTTVPPLGGSDMAELDGARRRWAAASVPTFSYVFEDDCGECMPISQQVVVWDGAAASGGEQVPSIDEMFATIESAITEGLPVDVAYDEDLGYPAEVWIDREARAYDGGTHWLIDGFAGRLPGKTTTLGDLDSAEAKWRAGRPPSYSFRTTIICDCELDGWLWTRVDGDQIVDWEMELTPEASTSLSPTTMDQLLDDLRELFTPGVEQDGVRVGGSAEYDPELGYPVWIGLDIEVLDPDGELAFLPPWLVFSIDQFTIVEPGLDLDAGTDLRDLEQAQERWAAAGLTDYAYMLTVHDIIDASYSDPYEVTVIDSQVAAVTLDGAPVDEFWLPAYPVDQLFTVIQLWAQSGMPVEVIYNEPLGFPAVVVRKSQDSPLVFSISELFER